jgi:hypothetical protein
LKIFSKIITTIIETGTNITIHTNPIGGTGIITPAWAPLLGYLDGIGLQGLLEQGMVILGKVVAVGGKLALNVPYRHGPLPAHSWHQH